MGFFHIIQISRHDPVAFNKNLANFAGLTGVTSFDRFNPHQCAGDRNADTAGAVVVSWVD